ncbi:MAG TPA: hypothetical protein VMJ34_18940 [Bryobacteraceae bacterium]|nr:hypothetical protein [Bryobacteraceae bacterium]
MRNPLFAFALIPVMFAAATPDRFNQMAARFARADLRVATAQLSPADRQALVKLIEASRIVNHIFLNQLWSGNAALGAKLRQDHSALGRARLRCFDLNKGPWSDLDAHKALLADVPERKPLGANFYPLDMTREEFEAWAKTLSAGDRARAESFFTVIRRGGDGKLKIVPYSEEYHADLERAAELLKEAAALTGNATLKRFLNTRADAFLSNDYHESDMAWMDLDAPLDITIGPYETYNDELFGYKAAFEAFVNIRDEAETHKVQFFAGHMQEIENNLPVDAKYRNPKLGAAAPIRVVNEVLAAGDGDHGVKVAAYNLPNDERVVAQKGSKRVMLRNVQEAKFQSTLVPISKIVLSPADQKDLSFDAFFTHILAHEMTHGIGPHEITVNGRATNPRKEMKELYSAIEEAKADVTGLFMLRYMYDHKLMPSDEATTRRLYVTFLASAFRSLRFGITEAHGRGMALQLNYLLDKGGFVENADGTFSVNESKIAGAVGDLDHDLLTLEATGDYGGAKHMLETLAVVRPSIQAALDRLKAIPVDIDPVFVTADQLAK